MVGKKPLWLALAAVLGLAIGAVLLVPSWRGLVFGYLKAEPTHQGKPLSYWAVQAQYKNRLSFNPHDDGSRERHTAFEALLAIGPDAVPALEGLLADSDDSDEWAVPWEAAITLGRMGPRAQAAFPTLVRELKNENQARDTRFAIIESLGQINADDAFPVYLEALKDPETSVRRTAAVQLGRVQGARAETAVSALREALKTEEDELIRLVITRVIAPDADPQSKKGDLRGERPPSRAP